MKIAGAALACAGLAAIAWAAVAPLRDITADLTPDPAQDSAATSVPAARARPAGPPPVTSDTPMADRVAVIGLLNKRNGVARDLVLRPGQAVRYGDVVVRLRACDTTADWEPEKLTGAFVQTDLRGADGQWRRIFSGWLFKETPSLNVVENPLYDVWPKSCTMRHPDIGPDTIAASASAPRPIAKKSAEPADGAEPAGAAPSPSASSNSAT